MPISETLFHTEETLGAREALVKNCHERVEHFGAHVSIDVLVVLETHMLGSAARHIVVEHGLSKQLDVLLVTDPIPVVHILALFVLVEALSVLWSHHLARLAL